MLFPEYRPRRLRGSEALRRMVRETALSVDDLVLPVFAIGGKGVRNPIESMPGWGEVPTLITPDDWLRSIGVDPDSDEGLTLSEIVVTELRGRRSAPGVATDYAGALAWYPRDYECLGG